MAFADRKGISVASGFKLQAKAPLDPRFTVTTIAERDELVTINASYPGMTVYVEDTDTTYELKKNGTWSATVTGVAYTHPSTHPISMITETTDLKVMTSAERTKLAGIETGANKYTHPATHAATMITEDATHRFMTDTERTKLNGIAANANNYVHPANHAATMITQDSTHRFVTDTEKASYADKYTKSEVDNKFTTFELNMDWKESVENFSDIATAYPTPDSGWTVNVTSEGKTYRYNGTQWLDIFNNAIPKATSALDGLMSKEDKSKLDGIAAKANNYVHPSTHAATMITEDTTHRFMTDAERTKLTGIAANANKYTHPSTHAATMITEDTSHKFATEAQLTKLDGIEAGANKYVHPSTHAATMITQDSTHRFMTDAERTKLTGIANNANNYVHPANHAASVITQDASHRFVTDTEKTSWNNKANIMFATSDSLPASAPVGTVCFVTVGSAS